MRSGLVQTGAWAAATGAAVLLSWLGVSSVLSDSAFGPARTLPLPSVAVQSLGVAVSATAGGPTPAKPSSPPARRGAGPEPGRPAVGVGHPAAPSPPAPGPSATGGRPPGPTASPSPTVSQSPVPGATGTADPDDPDGPDDPFFPGDPGDPDDPGIPDGQSPDPTAVHSYLVPGGRVALDVGTDSADLVSAAPDGGWQMQVWHGDEWLRIDFSRGDDADSVYVTWNGHPPAVQTVVR
ncbi:hypothetical protein ACIGXM_23280 [Kitasatospora sp. NPDC052896]|uniref:hypothetical protein n=1 Tax=Kitasatospora sp. NPDC052896 TaxID=3364061 RepID=UPI0037CB70EC